MYLYDHLTWEAKENVSVTQYSQIIALFSHDAEMSNAYGYYC